MLYYIFLPDLFLSVSYFQQPTSTFQADMQHIYLDSADLDKMTIFYFSAEIILCVIHDTVWKPVTDCEKFPPAVSTMTVTGSSWGSAAPQAGLKLLHDKLGMYRW